MDRDINGDALTDSKKYGLALVGCGSMGAAHLDDIYEKENIVLRYVCDTDEARAKAFAVRYGAERYVTDYNKIFDDEKVDIVIISTYPSSHYEILKKCIEHKKHAICEKPLADNYDRAAKIVRLVEENPDVKVLIGYILRHNKTYNRVAEMIQNGAIGKPVVMRMTQNHHTMDWQKYLRLICETSPILDCGVHYIDVMRWFTGAEVSDVSGIGLRTEADVPENNYNYGLITIKMSDGSIGYYEAGWGNTIAAENLKEFIGPRGRIKITHAENRHENKEEGDLVEYYTYPEGKYETINIPCKRKPTGAQLDELVRMIETGCVGTPSIDDVWKSFKVAEYADKKIKEKL